MEMAENVETNGRVWFDDMNEEVNTVKRVNRAYVEVENISENILGQLKNELQNTNSVYRHR